jgi:hypothetical protein
LKVNGVLLPNVVPVFDRGEHTAAGPEDRMRPLELEGGASRAPRPRTDDPVGRQVVGALPGLRGALGARPKGAIDPRRPALVQVAVGPQDGLPRSNQIAPSDARAADAHLIDVGPLVAGDAVGARRQSRRHQQHDDRAANDRGSTFPWPPPHAVHRWRDASAAGRCVGRGYFRFRPASVWGLGLRPGAGQTRQRPTEPPSRGVRPSARGPRPELGGGAGRAA